MRFYSFGTDFKYSIGRIARQEIYTDAADGGVRLAFVAEAGEAGGFHLDEEGRPHVVVPSASLDYAAIIEACHVWMEKEGVDEEPVWFLALPPGKKPAEFLSIRRRP